ncbi:MAG TPA: hypothetical protein PKH54_04765 [Myxococcota bacterium]|nr:hypothetical protein [Myxococcota bacterium]
MKRSLIVAVATTFLLAAAAGCGGGSGEYDVIADVPAGDIPADLAMPDTTPADVQDPDAGADATEPDGATGELPDQEVSTNDATDDGLATDTVGDAFVKPDHLPTALPVEFTRPQVGDPLSAEEVTEFTVRFTGFLKDTGYFKWVYDTSHGYDASTGKPDWMVWWQDVDLIKEDGKLTFYHGDAGGAHNVMIPTTEILSAAQALYMQTGDEWAARVAEQYCKGITATMTGFLYDENDENIYVMARNIIGQNHEWTDINGHSKAVDFSHWYTTYSDWNAERFEYASNPVFGDIWVTNLRSKDDVCHMFRTMALLPYLVQSEESGPVHEACSETLEYMKGFARDIVDFDYNIRTKDSLGVAYLPGCENEKDLSSFVCFVGMDDQNECTARASAALVAYGDTRDVDCKSGFNSVYDQFSQITHCFNYHINWNFHMAAVANALVNWELDYAMGLMAGLAKRMDSVLHPTDDEPGPKNCTDYEIEGAQMLAMTAPIGMPLTNEEVHHIHKIWDRSIASYESWPRWDMWAETVPDGTYKYHGGDNSSRPKARDFVNEDGKTERLELDIQAIPMLLEYCNSPLLNPSGAVLLDCDIVRDPARWGVMPDAT